MSNRLFDPFPTPSDLLSTLQTFLLPDFDNQSGSTGQSDDYELRTQRMRTGWERRAVKVDSRFVGPSTITGYYTRRSKIVRSVIRPVFSRFASLHHPDLTLKAEGSEAVRGPVADRPEELGLEEEEEDEAEAQPLQTLSPVPATTSLLPDEQTSTLIQSTQGIFEDDSVHRPRMTVIWVDWHIVYHPTYRIPSLCFTVAWEDGTPLKLQELLDHHVLRPPTTSPAPPTGPGVTDEDQDHIILSSDSPFPLLLQEPHPCIKDLVVWMVHPCHVKPHISELLGDLELDKGVEAEKKQEMMTRWMELWMGLHSRLLQDL